MAKNMVIAGDYKNKLLGSTMKYLTIKTGFRKSVPISKETVEAYEVVDEEHRTKAMSAIGRGMVGSLALGPAGLLAGLSAKKKKAYLVAIKFKDGKESLIEMNDIMYKHLVQTLF
ncbi:hypothetical protein [Clostridium sp. Cult1]|uniref:hypothetical protein n=1 Tax=Clostridium sp. Cult1 TaxID=2079002 RepID=UPI0009BA66F2|nr:hypothetical protein [Clostridium sp. Cult1]MCF6464207.1 hypothetical protein [Clostridium sp. Cult1]